ncbi:type I restriction enzyme HsdR N-terminal domain-containing protein [soil metagenome]
MLNLNLPSYDPKVRRRNNKIEIFDPIRKKYILLTPEEWVRQHFVNYLVRHMHYPRSLIRMESGLKYNSLQKRSDILVYNRLGIPFMLVECKAAEVKLNQKVVEQIAVYNHIISAPYMVITNGITHYCYKKNQEDRSFEHLRDLPAFV